MSVTMDFGTRLPFAAFFLAGLIFMLFIIFFQTVAHVHFPEIRKNSCTTASEF